MENQSPKDFKEEISEPLIKYEENNLEQDEKSSKKKNRKKNKNTTLEPAIQKPSTEKPKSKKKTAQSALAKKIHSAQLELERIKKEEEEEKRRREEELQKELERQRLESEAAEKKRLEEKEKKKRLKKEGKILSKYKQKQKNKDQENLKRLLDHGTLPSTNIVNSENTYEKSAIQNDVPENEIDELCGIFKTVGVKEKPSIVDPVERIQKRLEDEKLSISDKLRSPIICVMGHVDTGKTKILDKLRNTNVQDGEAGGITQQIGVTNIPLSAIKQYCSHISEMNSFDYKISGISIIDTPGHFSFRNLRSLGSSLCDMAILVVDIMGLIEEQTIESIKLLLSKKTPFVVALNKIDLIVDWKSKPKLDIQSLMLSQPISTKAHFDDLFKKAYAEFAKYGLNLALAYQDKDPNRFISAVPTSAHTGDGLGDIIAFICKYSQKNLSQRLLIKRQLEATVMEVKTLHGLGSTIDVILVNGILRKGDKIIVGGVDGPIVSQIRALLTPQPLKEMRVKGTYQHHDFIIGSRGVKISGPNLEDTIAGLPLFVAEYEDEIEFFSQKMKSLISQTMNAFEKQDKGVYVHASTLGSLEALLDYLRDSKIPYFNFNIGPVHKRDVINASTMIDQDPLHAVILAFDVRVDLDAQSLADKNGVRIFTADIIYHLSEQYQAYEKAFKLEQANKFRHLAVFPCILKIIPECIFKTRDPIIVGVHVEEGTVRIGTPLCVPLKNNIVIGIVVGIESNHKSVEIGKTGQDVCLKIGPVGEEAPRAIGRHFEATDTLISRDSIDVLKNYFRDEVSKNEWKLIVNLKKTFDII